MIYNFLKFKHKWKRGCLFCGGKLKKEKIKYKKTYYRCQECSRKWDELTLKGMIAKRSIYWKYRKLKNWFKK